MAGVLVPGGDFAENGSMAPDPRQQVRAWLPHILILGALVMAVWLLARVAAPLFEPVLMAAAIAILTAPVVAEPLNRFLRQRLPKLGEGLRRKLAGIGATVLIVLAALAPLLLVVASQANNLSELTDTVVGLATRKPETIEFIVEKVEAQVEEINQHYPRLGLDSTDIGDEVRELLLETADVNKAFLNFIRAGTGTVAQIVLALVSLAYFFIDGARLVRGLLAYSPLSDDQQRRLIQQHRRIVLRLLNDTVATAIVKGLVLGTIVYAIDHLLGDGTLPFAPVAIVAALITLLPLVGVTMVWLPFAGLAWSMGNRVGAVLLVITCWSSNFFLDRYRRRVNSRLEKDSDWLGFLLFVGVVGGLLTYGPKGLIIGPFAVVLVITVGRAWLPLYIDDPETEDVPEPALQPAADAADE